ncbi:GNAT family N-acetyltransferase [Chitinimonas sp.]|uniref:GNAT family N-acetyltransferase n=1 Tax=Chitinimonas sp. TaxID=1934313 RepID=UPI0035AFDBE7
MNIRIDDLRGDAIRQLLQEHLDDMYATSPPESVHALDLDALRHPSITFWSIWDGEVLAGCIALKRLDACHGEIKSMRTPRQLRRRGAARLLLDHLIGQARRQGYTRLSLETGSMDFFKPAHALYASAGFTFCGPFGDYVADPNSVFMTRELLAA